MNLKVGNVTFRNVEIPLLWGSRAVLQDQQGRLSVIDLSSSSPRLEILRDKPAPGIKYHSIVNEYMIYSGGRFFRKGKPVYHYNAEHKILVSHEDLDLPVCQVGPWEVRVGSDVFDFMMTGSVVGIEVTKDGMAIGVPLPPTLARLVI